MYRRSPSPTQMTTSMSPLTSDIQLHSQPGLSTANVNMYNIDSSSEED